MYSLLLLPLLSINIAMNKIKQMNYLIKIEDSFLENETPAVGKKAVVIRHVVFLSHTTVLTELEVASPQSSLPVESDCDGLSSTSLPISGCEDTGIHSTSLSATITYDLRPEDETVKKRIEKFCEEGCGCPENCSANYTLHHYETLRSQCSELDHDTLDMVIMGQIMALTTTTQERRQTTYMHLGLKVIIYNQQF